MRFPLLVLAALAVAPATASAYDGLMIGARSPGTAPISIEGVDTSQARAVAEITPALFKACEDGDGQACSTYGSYPGRRITVTADCKAGSIVNERGERFTHVGTWSAGEQPFPPDVGLAKFQDAEGRVVPTSNAFDGEALAGNYATLCPQATQAGVRQRTTAAPADGAATGPDSVALSTLGGMPYDHNGSIVIVDPEKGLIVYAEPKASLRKTIRPGTVLFRGPAWDSAKQNVVITGMARVFKKGCAPAEYTVRGMYSQDGGMQEFTLDGSAPVRSSTSCRIEMHSINTRNAVLKFSFYESDG